MEKFNADEIKQLAEPIEVQIDGQTYKVETISQATLDQVKELAESAGTDTLAKQVGTLLGVAPETFHKTDIRKLGAVLKFLGSQIKGDLESKNG